MININDKVSSINGLESVSSKMLLCSVYCSDQCCLLRTPSHDKDIIAIVTVRSPQSEKNTLETLIVTGTLWSYNWFGGGKLERRDLEWRQGQKGMAFTKIIRF